MKKSVLLTVALASTLLVAGCGTSTEGDQIEVAAGEKDSEKVQVKLWFDSSKDNSGETIEKAIEAALPHIDIVHESVAPWDSVAKLQLDGPAGFGPDVFAVVHDQLANAMDASLLLPVGEKLSNFIDEKITETAASTVRFDDAYYGVPNETATLGFFYNKTLLDEYGLDVATDWSEIVEQAKVFNNPAENKYIVRFDADDAYVSHFFLTANDFELFGPDHNDATKVNFDTEAVLNGLKDFKVIQEILPVPAGDLTWDTVHGEFVKGTVPYMVSGPWSIPDFEAAGVDFEWGMSTVPTINGKLTKTFSGNGIFGVSSYTQVAEASREVVEFLTSEAGAKLFYDEKMVMPALKDFSNIPGLADDEALKAVQKQAEYSQPMPTIPEISKYWEPAAAMFELVWNGKLSPEEAMKKAAEDFEMLLKMTE